MLYIVQNKETGMYCKHVPILMMCEGVVFSKPQTPPIEVWTDDINQAMTLEFDEAVAAKTYLRHDVIHKPGHA